MREFAASGSPTGLSGSNPISPGLSRQAPSLWDVLEHALAVIKGRGGTISVDPNLRKELLNQGQTRARFARMLDAADLVLPSGDELKPRHRPRR